MFPRNVKCDDCGRIASVRGYGRVEYDWPETTSVGHETTIPTITCVRLTVDCPRCGVKSQEFFPEGISAAPQHFRILRGVATSRKPGVRFQRLGPMNRPRI